MLTYAEKQQMIHLHEEDPDYWDAYKLAEGFPATPEIVKVDWNLFCFARHILSSIFNF